MANGSTLTAGSYNAKTSNVGDLVVGGARVSGDAAAARRVIQTNGEIKINENIRPLTAFILGMGGARNKTVGQSVVQHNERDMIPTTVIIDSSTYTSGSVTINFLASTGAQVLPGTILKVLRTGEEMFVSVKVDTDTATVTRAIGTGGAAAAALVASEELQILGSSFGQYSFAPNGVSVEPLIVSSYLQTFRTSVEMSGRDMNSEVYGLGEEQRLIEDRLESHMTMMEKAFLFNAGYNATDGAAQTSAATAILGTLTQGIFDRISTNLFAVGGALDETTLENYFVALSRYNADVQDSLITFVGEAAMRALDSFARDAVRYSENTTVLGVNVKNWQCSFGDFRLKKHGLFSPIGSANSAANGGPVGSVLTVNPKNLGILTFKGRDTRFEKNIQYPGQDGVKHCWTSDKGLDAFNERSMAAMTGLTN